MLNSSASGGSSWCLAKASAQRMGSSTWVVGIISSTPIIGEAGSGFGLGLCTVDGHESDLSSSPSSLGSGPGLGSPCGSHPPLPVICTRVLCIFVGGSLKMKKYLILSEGSSLALTNS